jgi:hypothetical protein
MQMGIKIAPLNRIRKVVKTITLTMIIAPIQAPEPKSSSVKNSANSPVI